jgi:hypothetical protein
LARCERQEPDVIVLSEFRDTKTGATIRAVRVVGQSLGLDADQYPFAIAKQRSANSTFMVCICQAKTASGRIYVASSPPPKSAGRRILAIGDFNSGRNETDIELNLRTANSSTRLAPPTSMSNSSNFGPNPGKRSTPARV